MLQLCRKLGVSAHAGALALLLLDMIVLTPWAAAAPEAWAAACSGLCSRPALWFMADLAGPLTGAAGGSLGGTGGHISAPSVPGAGQQ